MAYDEELADRVRFALTGREGISEKKMFGGVCFLIRGKMLAGVTKDDLMVRVGPDNHEALLAERGARPMDVTGRPMKGYLYVSAEGLRSDDDLARWVGRGADFAATLA